MNNEDQNPIDEQAQQEQSVDVHNNTQQDVSFTNYKAAVSGVSATSVEMQNHQPNKHYNAFVQYNEAPTGDIPVDYKFFATLQAPPTTKTGYKFLTGHYSNRKDTRNLDEWIKVFSSATAIQPKESWIDTVFNNEGQDWRAVIEHEGAKLRQGSVNKIDPGKLKGNAAIDAVRKKYGQAPTSRMPLWHSGFWLYYKPMSGQDISDLTTIISQSKMLVGTDTYGRVFSTDSAYIDREVLNFFFNRLVTSSSISLDNKTQKFDYMDHILLPDKNVIYGYLMAKCFPNGVHHERACINIECGHINTGLLNLENIVKINRSALSQAQIKHMKNAAENSMSLESIKEYKKDFDWINRDFTENEVRYEISIPTIKRYLDISVQYLDNLHNTYNEALYEKPEERASIINKSMNSTACMQYAHFIDRIVVQTTDSDLNTTQESIIDDIEDIYGVLESISTDAEDVKRFIKSVNKASADSIIAMTALTSYKCAKCHKYQNDNDTEDYKTLIPINALAAFFSLCWQLVQELSATQTKVQDI